MNSEQVLVSKNLIQFALRNIIKYEMLDRQMGVYDTFFKSYTFSEEDFKEINNVIKDDMFPSGYYDLCNIICSSYSV